MKYKMRFFAFFAAMVVFNLAANFAHPVTPTVIQELHLHDYMFGVALAVMLITNFLLSPFWGKINNYISSRLSLLICCLGYGVAQIWFAYATTELMIILARMFAGLFTGGIFVSFLTYIVNKSNPEDQGKYLTYSATIKSVASAFGYMIGGFLGESSVRLAFLVQAGTLIAVAVAFFMICEPDSTANLKDIPAKQLMKEANPFQAFIDSKNFMCMAFVFLFAINIFINFGNTGFDQAFNYYLKAQLGLTSSYNGIIKAGVGFVSFIANMSLCIWIIKKTNVKKVHGRPHRLLCAGGDRNVDLREYRNLHLLQHPCLCGLLRQRPGPPEHGGESGGSETEKPCHGILQRDPVPGKYRGFPDSRIYLFCKCKASVCMHLRDLLGWRCGGVRISVLP